MQKNNIVLTALCVLSMIFLLIMQGSWIIKYYGVSRNVFEKEAGLAFEDALRKEFEIRADSIAEILHNRLLDTNHFIIRGALHPSDNRIAYSIRSVKDTLDRYSNTFSLTGFDKPITSNKDTLRNQIAGRFTEMLRSEDLENHLVYYRTQELGRYMVEVTNRLEFDTARLRPVLNRYLAKRNIFVPYTFYTSAKDSTMHKSTFKSELQEKFPVITRALPTFRHSAGQNFVRVMFHDPFSYILLNMWVMWGSAILLVVLLAYCMNRLISGLYKEKKLSQIKNDFISNITHEFKTPIATALVAIEALSDDQIRQDSDKTNRYLGYAKNELNRISGLTDKVLKLSLYDQGNFVLKKELFEIRPVISEIIALHELSEKPVSINFENGTGIDTIYADRIQFQHAIANVVENAIKYGSDTVQVNISCNTDKDYLVIAIRDNGPGIDQMHIPYVFERFYRVKQHANVKGHGLGLNYVQQIMEQHSGWCKLTSNGRGTELKLAWPI